jgi:hypothetical protein
LLGLVAFGSRLRKYIVTEIRGRIKLLASWWWGQSGGERREGRGGEGIRKTRKKTHPSRTHPQMPLI